MEKTKKYEELASQIGGLVEGENNTVGVLANVSSILHYTMGWWWTGFYLVGSDGWLYLGPFQGPLACSRIAHGRGVCGTSWAEGRTVVVPDVEQFPGHIACSCLSRSEIVVPVRDTDNEIVGVLDIDSRELNTFDATDATHLERIVALLKNLDYSHFKTLKH